MRVALIPCGGTEWHADGRLIGRVELSLTDDGRAQCTAWAESLRPLNLGRLLHSTDELATQSAALLAAALDIPTRALDELAEVDLGLWAGLTETELKQRFATAHRELRGAPLNVQPPGGESLRAASDRLRECIARQVRKNGVTALGIVVRPFSWALTHWALGGGNMVAVWDEVRRPTGPLVLDCARPD
jgi:broad specificity phosphatase PhoE